MKQSQERNQNENNKSQKISKNQKISQKSKLCLTKNLKKYQKISNLMIA